MLLQYFKGNIVPIVFTETIIPLIIASTAIAVMTATAFYVLRLLRERSLQQEPNAKNHLDYFEELKREGNITVEEYRHIKKRLSAQIIKELQAKSQSEQSDSWEQSEELAALIAQGSVLRDVEHVEGGVSPDDTARFGKDDDNQETKLV